MRLVFVFIVGVACIGLSGCGEPSCDVFSLAYGSTQTSVRAACGEPYEVRGTLDSQRWLYRTRNGRITDDIYLADLSGMTTKGSTYIRFVDGKLSSVEKY